MAKPKPLWFFFVELPASNALAGLPKLQCALDHAGGIWPPIDKVAEKDELRLRRSTATLVRLDTKQQLVKQIEAAVHVADRINPQPVRHARRGRGGLDSAAEKLENHGLGKLRNWRPIVAPHLNAN